MKRIINNINLGSQKNEMSSLIFSENTTPRQKGSGSTELSSSYSEWKNEPPCSSFRHKKRVISCLIYSPSYIADFHRAGIPTALVDTIMASIICARYRLFQCQQCMIKNLMRLIRSNFRSATPIFKQQ